MFFFGHYTNSFSQMSVFLYLKMAIKPLNNLSIAVLPDPSIYLRP